MSGAQPRRDGAAISQLTELRLAMLANGFRPVPISSPTMNTKSAGKRPIMQGWQDRCANADAAEVQRWSKAEVRCTNTGLLCGNIAGVDIDILEPSLSSRIDRLAEATLGSTPLHRIGKAPKCLRCYRVETPLAKIETPELLFSDGRKAQVEVLGKGQQFVAYGTHPDTKQPYRWTGQAPHEFPAANLPVVTEAALREFVQAAEAILRAAGGRTEKEIEAERKAEAAPKTKPAGARNTNGTDGETFFRKVNDRALADIRPWLQCIFPKAREEAGTGAWRVSSADMGRALEEDLSIHPTEGAKDFGTRKPCTAIDIVLEHGGAATAVDAALYICDKLGINPADLGWNGREKARNYGKDEVASLVAEFNERFMMVNEDGKAIILQPGFDPILKRRKYDRLTTRDLQTLYMNRLIKVGTDDKGGPIWKTAADVWLRHRDRRQFIHGVEFDPGAKPRPGVLNLWEGYAVRPKPGDWSLMRDHMHDVICAGDDVRFDYLERWLARMFQHPAEMGEVAVVMKGVEGCGKGTLARAIMHIMGGHGLAISNAKHLVGNFNAHLASTVFLFADEAFFAGDRAHVAVLKALITEKQLAIEAKFANMHNQANFLHLMMASNEEWVVPASLEARRFFVLDVPASRVKDYAYFSALWKQMEAGGYEAMLFDLLRIDLSGFNVRAVPQTDGLQQQRKLSLPTAEAWWLDCLDRGHVFRSKLGLEGELSIWHARISTELLHASYIEFSKSRGERRPFTREDLGRFLVKFGSTPKRWRRGIVGEALRDEPNAFGGSSRRACLVYQDRATGHELGALPDARATFQRETGLAITWDSGAPESEAEE